MADDGKDLQGLLDELCAKVMILKDSPQEDGAQCDVCLLTRSAYTEFYSVCQLAGSVDTETAERITSLFETILSVLPPNSKYYGSVRDRFHEFQSCCEEIASRDELDTTVFP